MATDGNEFALRAFKNRELTLASPEKLAELWDNQPWWDQVRGAPRRAPSLDAKYPGYAVWKVLGGGEDHASMPSRALVVCRHADGTMSQYVLRYPTVQVHPPRPAVGGLVPMRLEETAPDTSKLPEVVWRQLGGPGMSRIVLLKLAKTGAFDANIAKDDVTGEAYPYVTASAYLLERDP